jgi:hypothetical protein
MLVINIHQAGSATLELQQRMWMAMQGIRARYPDIQGIIGGDPVCRERERERTSTLTPMAHGKDTLLAMRIISGEWMINFELAWQQSKE